jgi:hypothetical protein
LNEIKTLLIKKAKNKHRLFPNVYKKTDKINKLSIILKYKEHLFKSINNELANKKINYHPTNNSSGISFITSEFPPIIEP